MRKKNREKVGKGKNKKRTVPKLSHSVIISNLFNNYHHAFFLDKKNRPFLLGSSKIILFWPEFEPFISIMRATQPLGKLLSVLEDPQSI